MLYLASTPGLSEIGGKMDCKYQPIERVGLYIMVFLILLQTCDIDSNYNDVIERLDRIDNRIERVYE